MSAPHEVPALRTLLGVWLLLLLLTAATTAVAFVDLGRLNGVAAASIAAAKAGLVLLVFMELRQETRLIRLAVAAGALWLAILFALTAADYLTRGGPLG